MPTTRGLGIAGSLDHRIVEEVAAAVEGAGYSSFWANDTPGGEGLASIAAAARVTDSIDLGVGVIPVDRIPPAQIAERLVELGLPLGRVIVGVGSGGAKTGTMELVRNAVTELKRLVPVRVFVGALGPRMTSLGGEFADGLLLSWLIPESAKEGAELVRHAAGRAGRSTPAIATYLRVSLPEGDTRRIEEANRYAGFPAYAAHFTRMGVTATDTTIGGDGPEIQRRLSQFDGLLDEVVVRAIASEESVEAYLKLVQAAAPPARS